MGLAPPEEPDLLQEYSLNRMKCDPTFSLSDKFFDLRSHLQHTYTEVLFGEMSTKALRTTLDRSNKLEEL